MAETLSFQAEVRQLLDLVVHSLYSDREIFLRELVSNASDAIDRARFVGLQRSDLRAAEGEPRIVVTANSARGTITITDNGIGLTRAQAIEHLGTIAKSGTKEFSKVPLPSEVQHTGSASGSPESDCTSTLWATMKLL